MALTANVRGALLQLAAMGLYATHDVVIKSLGAIYPAMQILFFASLLSFPLVSIVLMRDPQPGTLRPANPGWVILRTLCAVVAGMAGFFAFSTLPLTQVYAILFTTPLLITILSIPLLGEKVGWHRWAAVIVGLTGVLIVLRPWEAGIAGQFGPSAVVMAGVGAWALAMISIRRMGQSGERNVTIVLLFSIGSTVLSALLALPVWVPPASPQLLALVGVGVISTGAQVLMTEGYRSGEATMLAPFEYGAIIYAVLLGWLIWAEVPDGWDFVGIGVLVLSGLYTWWREGRSEPSPPAPTGKRS